MKQRIIYQTDEGGIAVIIPTGEISLKETALKDVPSGVKYKIIDSADLPQERDFRNAWEYDFTDSYDGVGL